jgi:hypothetical protein
MRRVEVWMPTSSSTRPPNCGRRKILVVTDEFTREVPAIETTDPSNMRHAVQVMDHTVAVMECPPGSRQMHHDPELTALTLRDWCCFSHADSTYIEPRSLSESPFIESSNGRLTGDCPDSENFETLLTIKSVGRGLPYRLRHLSVSLLARLFVDVEVRRAVAQINAERTFRAGGFVIEGESPRFKFLIRIANGSSGGKDRGSS